MVRIDPKINRFSYTAGQMQKITRNCAVSSAGLSGNKLFSKNRVENDIYRACISLKNSMSEIVKNIIKKVH